MGVTMFVQMRMNPTPPDKTQAMIFNWMPVIFTFMLGSFPAGLVIYWAWNNTLSILQQCFIMRRQGVEWTCSATSRRPSARVRPRSRRPRQGGSRDPDGREFRAGVRWRG